jgi:hypothetical protein
MLESIGPVLHSTVTATRSKFQYIRAGVLIDLTDDVPDGIEVSDQGTCGLIPIAYRDLPEACYLSHQRGHFPRTCSQRSQRAKGTPEPM